jgi:hypothetical protein
MSILREASAIRKSQSDQQIAKRWRGAVNASKAEDTGPRQWDLRQTNVPITLLMPHTITGANFHVIATRS